MQTSRMPRIIPFTMLTSSRSIHFHSGTLAWSRSTQTSCAPTSSCLTAPYTLWAWPTTFVTCLCLSCARPWRSSRPLSSNRSSRSSCSKRLAASGGGNSSSSRQQRRRGCQQLCWKFCWSRFRRRWCRHRSRRC